MTLDLHLEHCLVKPITDLATEVGTEFNKNVIREYRISKSFQLLRHIFFMEDGTTMNDFCTQLF